MSEQNAPNTANEPNVNPDMSLADKAVNAITEATKKAEGQAEDLKAETDKVNEIIEIDALDKVKFNGKEYSPDELNRMLLRQEDYTKKTQILANERKFIDNLQYDLDNVRANPQLADQFKQIYPDKFHHLVDYALNTGPKPENELDDDFESSDITVSLKKKVDELENKLSQYDAKFHDEKVDAAQAQLDAVFNTLGQKYDLADEDAVINRAQRMLAENAENPHFEMTQAHWDRLFRADHESRENRYSERQKKLVESQAERGKLAIDGGSGGQGPGRARKRMTFDEATEMAVEDEGRR